MATDSTHYDDALSSFQNGELQAAFQQLKPLLAYPKELKAADRWQQAWSLFAEIAAGLGVAKLPQTIQQWLASPDDIQLLYNLGYQLVEVGLPRVAASPLLHANKRYPNQEPIVTELVTALEQAGFNGSAVEVLQATPILLERSSLCQYLLAFNSIMNGDLKTAHGIMPVLEATEDDQLQFMAARIRQMLNRGALVAEVSSLNEQDLRGWHYVINNSLLLHISPFGFDEGMNGRYAYVNDGVDLVSEGLSALQGLLKGLSIPVSQILYLPTANSKIVAQAAAKVLNCLAVEFSETNATSEGLVIAYDLNEVEPGLLPLLQQRSPQQYLWVHAACWTQPPALAADFITYLYQSKVDIQSAVPFDTGQATKTLSPEELVSKTVEATIELSTDTTKLERLVASLLKAGSLFGSAPRGRFWDSSPVKSSRFA